MRLGKADLHIHSSHSDGRPSVKEILDYVEDKTDLDIIAIADHDKMSGYFEALDLMKKKKYRFEIIPATEVTSREGHILALFMKEPIEKGLTAHTTIKKIHQQGGFAVAAHPFEQTRFRDPNYSTLGGVGLVTLIKEKDSFDAVEVVNATPTQEPENVRAAFINRTILLRAETGSSDAHILEAIGMGYTLFEGKTVKDLRRALYHHQTQAISKKWALVLLFKYLFFFLPMGVRQLLYTIFHGRRPKQPSISGVPDFLS